MGSQDSVNADHINVRVLCRGYVGSEIVIFAAESN